MLGMAVGVIGGAAYDAEVPRQRGDQEDGLNEAGRYQHVIADEEDEVARGEVKPDGKYAGIMLVLPRPYDLGLMADGVCAMGTKGVEDFLLRRGRIIDQDELAIQIEPRNRKQDRGEASRSEFGIVA